MGVTLYEHTDGTPKAVSAAQPLPVIASSTAAEGLADDAAFVVGTSKVLPIGALCDDTSPDAVDEGDIGIPRMTALRQLITWAGANPKTPASYRTSVVAADVLAAPGTVTCTKIAGAGLTDGTYYVAVVAGNAYGRTTRTLGNTTITTETTNLRINAAFAAVTGATFYDIYCSTDAEPKFCGRITEAQRASGIIIDTINHTTAGGTAGSVDIGAIGTGLVAATTCAVNTAYSVPASPVACAGYNYCDFDLFCSRTGDLVAPALVVVPFYLNSRTSLYTAGTPVTITFGGTSGQYGSLYQRTRVEVRGWGSVALLVQQIAGTGMSVNIDATLS